MRVIHVEQRGTAINQLQSAVQQRWGSSQSCIDIADTSAAIFRRLAESADWPDLVVVSWQTIEQTHGLLDRLLLHPGYGFFRLVITVQSSDEFDRAAHQANRSPIVMEPVTADRLTAALTADRTVATLNA